MTDRMTTLTLAEAARGWDALRAPIWLYDPINLKGVYANRAALLLWGASSLPELLARDLGKLSPAVLARVQRLAQVTADGGDVVERWTFYPKGEPVTVAATISTFHLEDGRPVLLFEAAPAEVSASERRAVEALRHTPVIVTLFDADGRPVFGNPAAYQAYGEDRAFADRFAEPSRGEALISAARAGETASDIFEAETSAGRRWHQADIRPVLDPVTGAAGVLLNERDVTLRVEAERGRVAAEQKAAMAEARQQFLAEMSHELRTPLNAVLGFSELLSGAGLEAEQASQIKRIHEAGQRLAVVVEEMIALSEGGELPAAEAKPSNELTSEGEISSDDAPLRVLYVDDNDSNRVLVRAILSSQGVACETADDGALGLEAVRSGEWDVILMDIQMPVMNGVEAALAIRALDEPLCSIPIVAVTANTLPEQIEDYARAGMVDCIAKPVRPATLLAAVAHWGDAGRNLRAA